MGIKLNPLSRLEADLRATLSKCADSGQAVVELPDQRLVAIQSLDPGEDDTLISELLESNPRFQALVAKSKASPRKPFTPANKLLPTRGRRSQVRHTVCPSH
jgi:hypothetical protein